MRAEPDRLVLGGEPEIEVMLRRTARARRISLRVSRLDGRVTLTVPQRVRIEDATRFLLEKGDWVRGHVVARGEDRAIVIGGSVMVEGDIYPIVALEPSEGSRPKWRDGTLAISSRLEPGPQVMAILKALARDRLTEASDRYSSTLGRPYTRLTLRDTRSRWGSCSTDGRLMYSWRLVMAPPDVLQYVAAHEVAHLVEMNHSPAFWKQVARICPDYREHRQWLRRRGTDLHAYRFSA